MKNNAELISALNVISKQRGISVDILADAIESALRPAPVPLYSPIYVAPPRWQAPSCSCLESG